MKKIILSIFLLVSCFSIMTSKAETLGNKVFQTLTALSLNDFVKEIDQFSPEQFKERAENYLTKKVATFYTEQQKNKTTVDLQPGEFLYLKELKKDPIVAYLLDVKNIPINLSIQNLIDAGYSFKKHINDQKITMYLSKKLETLKKTFSLQNTLINSLEGLQNIPKISTVKQLDLQHNKIKSIKELKKSLFQKIESINLNDNLLQVIENDIFIDFKNIQNVSIVNNKISSDAYSTIKNQLPKECLLVLEK